MRPGETIWDHKQGFIGGDGPGAMRMGDIRQQGSIGKQGGVSGHGWNLETDKRPETR